MTTENKNSKKLPIKIGLEKIKSKKTSPKENKTVSSINSEETNLIDCIQILLRLNNVERSHGSIRSMADISEGSFDYKDAVSALRNMEFDANVGKLPFRKLNNGLCPFIAEFKDNKKAVVTKITSKKEYIVFDLESSEKFKKISAIDFKKEYDGGVLLAKSRKQIRNDKKPKKLIGFGLL